MHVCGHILFLGYLVNFDGVLEFRDIMTIYSDSLAHL